MLFLFSANLMANKTSVELSGPSGIKKGSDVTITIKVMHKGNSKMHHTDWVSLKINGQEVKRWEYNKENLPPDGNFTLEYKTTVTGDLNLEAQGHCNMHGSTGPNSLIIKAN